MRWYQRNRPLDAHYRLFRELVLQRDHYRCKRCKKRTKPQVHHIRKYCDHVALRYDVNNGITLCYKCHVQMKGCEEGWEPMCLALIASENMRLRMGKALQVEEQKELEEKHKPYIGVYFNPARNKWLFKDSNKYIKGGFKTREEAAAARAEYMKEKNSGQSLLQE